MIIHGDCMEELKKLSSNSIDSLITDPPAFINFMGKSWDSDRGGRDQSIAWLTEVMVEALRVLKPGAHGLVWAIPRTSHWTMTALENAGFEVRDVVTHLFGSGFPKSHNISKSIDNQLGVEQTVIGKLKNPASTNRVSTMGRPEQSGSGWNEEPNETAPTSDLAKKYSGWGTALKPAAEFWVLVRKPIAERTVAANVIKYGTGGINIDASRIGSADPDLNRKSRANKVTQSLTQVQMTTEDSISSTLQGRFPANLVLDEDAASALDEQSGVSKSGKPSKRNIACGFNPSGQKIYGSSEGVKETVEYADSGGASRFFYVAKASKKDKNNGLEGMAKKDKPTLNKYAKPSEGRTAPKNGSPQENFHPTVKSTTLMQYLIRLITPVGGVVLDPFMGSGSTGVAAKALGFEFIGIEKQIEYVEIAEKRIGT